MFRLYGKTHGMEHSFFEVLNVRLLTLGGRPLTLLDLVVMVAAIVLSWFASRLVAGLIHRLRGRFDESNTALYLLEKFAGYGIFIVGILFALSAIGLNLSSLAVFAGALGIGVGLGLQGVVKEFVSGLVLLFDSILNVGDYIELPGAGNLRGVVHEIGARAVHIRTNDNLDIFVPNSRLIEERFVNWTLRGQTRRIHIPFSVAYGSDKSQVREVVLGAVAKVEATLPDEGARRSQVWLVGFGDSALNFELVVWPTLAAVKRPRSMTAAYTWAIDDALREAGIEMPFPQRDIRVRSLFNREGDDAYLAMGLSPSLGPQTRQFHSPGRNDALQDIVRADEDDLDPPQRDQSKG